MGTQVLVVGGGDSALEAAIQLAEETDAKVAISYRRPEFGRCRQLNKDKLDQHRKSGRIATYMSSEIVCVEREAVVLKNGTIQRIPNDFVIACLGGELPNEFLKSVGISMRKHVGDKAMANPSLGRQDRDAVARRQGRRARIAFTVVGLLVIAGLAAVGWKYYGLPRGLRYKAPGHAFLKPSGIWGHGIGVLATLFMLLNFVYSARKRLPWFKRRGEIAPWLRFHLFVGIMSPTIILFHTAFQWGNHLATTTYTSLVVVVMSGLIGRYFYGWMRFDPQDLGEANHLGQSLAQIVDSVPAEWRQHAQAQDAPLHHIFTVATQGPSYPRSLPALFLHLPFEALRVWRGLRNTRRLFTDKILYHAFCADFHVFRRLRIKYQFHRHFKRLMSVWRVLHVLLAILLVGLIGLHVWVSWRVGFRWLWS
jgi:dihydropyrimidine dehydrogenase (NAD+) subunit PreT